MLTYPYLLINQYWTWDAQIEYFAYWTRYGTRLERQDIKSKFITSQAKVSVASSIKMPGMKLSDRIAHLVYILQVLLWRAREDHCPSDKDQDSVLMRVLP